MQNILFSTTVVILFIACASCDKPNTSQAISSPEAAGAHTLSPTTGGWQNTRWGMTSDEIRKAMPEAEPLEKPETFERIPGRKRVATIGVKDFAIEGQSYTVYFLMDESDRLEEVILQPNGKHFPSIIFESLEKLLTEKYGKPSLSQGGLNHSRTDVWNLTAITVTLNYLKFETVEFATLIYSKPQKATLDKL